MRYAPQGVHRKRYGREEIKMKTAKKSYGGSSSVIIVLFAAIAVLILSYALTNRLTYLREEAQYKAFSESVSRYALEYVYRKYGIEAEIVSESGYNRKRYDSGVEMPGYIYADYTMKDQKPDGGEKEFTVYVYANIMSYAFFQNGEKLSCTDNYQLPDIEESIGERIKSAFGESVYLRMSLNGNLPLDVLYNGNNLDYILKNITGTIEGCLSDNADLGSPAVTELLGSLKGNDKLSYMFTFWNSPEILEEFADFTDSQKFRAMGQNTWYELYAPYITSFITDETDKPQTLCMSLSENCAYCYFPADIDLAFSDKSCARLTSQNAEICARDDIGIKSYMSDTEGIKPLSKSHAFESETKSGDVCIYVPLKNFEEAGITAENTAAVNLKFGGISPARTVKPQICGEYAVYVLDRYSAFMFVDISGAKAGR